MRYIPTPDEKVEELRKKAKKLQRKEGGKHTELLDKVARQANYFHWHHVVECNARGKAATGMAALRRECEAIVAAELAGQIKVASMGPGSHVGAFVLFSTGLGDAWLLDPDEQMAMCLVWQGRPIALNLSDDPSAPSLGFHGGYELRGPFFHVESALKEIGDRTLGGYPLDELRPLLEAAKPFDIKFAEIFGQFDAVELTPDIVATLVRQGWSEERVLEARDLGHRYSPSRDTMLMPAMSSDDELMGPEPN